MLLKPFFIGKKLEKTFFSDRNSIGPLLARAALNKESESEMFSEIQPNWSL